MAISLRHAFTSAKADGTDPTLVQPSNWNAEHALTMATARILGRTTAATGVAEEIAVGSGLTLGSLTLGIDTAVVVTLSATQTLTNKTLTSPTVSGGTIDNAAIGGTTPAAGAFTTLSATGDGTFSGTGQIKVPTGTTAQRSGSPATGMFRFNTSTSGFEGYNGTAWGAVGGGAKGGGTDAIFYENGQTVTTDYTLTSNTNAMSAGPISINSGITVTVPSGAVWTIV